MSLQQKATKGFVWAFAERWLNQLVQFGVSLVLARLLTPSDFGIVALLSIFILVAETLVDSGLGRALVQKKQSTEVDFNSVFYISILASFVAYAVLFVCAPCIAAFYDNDLLVPLFRVQACGIVLCSINSIQNAELSRKMLFNLSFRISVIGSSVTATVGVTLAFLGYGPWALVWSTLAGQVIGVFTRWYFIAWRPRLLFSFSAAAELWRYGWKLALSSLLDTCYNNLYGLIIGKVYSKADLAFVNKGRSTPELAMGTFNTTLGRVAFPALAQVQDCPDVVREGARKLLTMSMFWVLPLMTGCAVCAPRLVPLLFGDQWIEAIPYMQLACFTLALWPMHTVNLQVITAMGRSDLFLKLEIVKKVIGLIVLLSVYRHGVWYMMAMLAFVCDPICALVNAWPNGRLIGWPAGRQFASVFPLLLAALFMGLVVWLLGLLQLPMICILSVQILGGTAIYFTIAWIFKMEPFVECIRMIKVLHSM